jgi:hypothetical protein
VDLQVSCNDLSKWPHRHHPLESYILINSCAPCETCSYLYMSAPFIQRGYTNLLRGVQQDAALFISIRNLNLDEHM